MAPINNLFVYCSKTEWRFCLDKDTFLIQFFPRFDFIIYFLQWIKTEYPELLLPNLFLSFLFKPWRIVEIRFGYKIRYCDIIFGIFRGYITFILLYRLIYSLNCACYRFVVPEVQCSSKPGHDRSLFTAVV